MRREGLHYRLNARHEKREIVAYVVKLLCKSYNELLHRSDSVFRRRESVAILGMDVYLARESWEVCV